MTGVLAVSVAIGAQTPVTHRFTPERFYNTFSFAHPPALKIRPGDRVVTKTIDAGGVDWNGKQVGQGPNPETGPFYIEGAEPGDAIVVTIEKIENEPHDRIFQQPARTVRRSIQHRLPPGSSARRVA